MEPQDFSAVAKIRKVQKELQKIVETEGQQIHQELVGSAEQKMLICRQVRSDINRHVAEVLARVQAIKIIINDYAASQDNPEGVLRQGKDAYERCLQVDFDGFEGLLKRDNAHWTEHHHQLSLQANDVQAKMLDLLREQDRKMDALLKTSAIDALVPQQNAQVRLDAIQVQMPNEPAQAQPLQNQVPYQAEDPAITMDRIKRTFLNSDSDFRRNQGFNDLFATIDKGEWSFFFLHYDKYGNEGQVQLQFSNLLLSISENFVKFRNKVFGRVCMLHFEPALEIMGVILVNGNQIPPDFFKAHNQLEYMRPRKLDWNECADTALMREFLASEPGLIANELAIQEAHWIN